MDSRKRGLNGQQQFWFDHHYILEDLDSIRDDLHRIADYLERNNN